MPNELSFEEKSIEHTLPSAVNRKWTVWQLPNDIDRVPCSPLAPDCRHWRRAKPSSSEGLYGGRPTVFCSPIYLIHRSVILYGSMPHNSCEKLRPITRYCLDKQTSARHPSWLNHPVCIMTSDHLMERVSFALMTLLSLQVAIDTNDQEPHPAYTVVRLLAVSRIE